MRLVAGSRTEYGPCQALATRFYRWVKAGMCGRVLAELWPQVAAEGELVWSLHHVDGGVIRTYRMLMGVQQLDAVG